MKASDQILFLLKTRGPKSAQQLAELLGVTSMGARRQLEAALDKGLVAFEDVADKVGRPARHWRLTDAGNARFPDRHSDLALQLIEQTRALFGEAGLERLITAREGAIEAHYRMQVEDQHGLAAQVAALARARDAEGYMAQSEVRDDGSVLLVENHCPICAAAKACQNFCRSELEVFQRVMGPGCKVERAEHLLAGARRCVYVIKPV
ncbi:MAG: metalloregulator ArsR/SmtB family transcription factor [Pseudomonadota bacterium]